MSVYHILRDGSTPKDITGHVVKISDADPLYRYLHSIAYQNNTYQNERKKVIR